MPDLAGRLAFDKHAVDKYRSDMLREAGIFMTVHPVLPGTLKCRNSSFLGSDRMNNLLKAHT